MTRVCCAGILVADTFCGPLAALPAEGQLVALEAMPQKVGGCAANVAIDLARQQIPVEVIGCVGTDAAAGVVIEGLGAHGIGCAGLRTTDRQPTSQTIVLLVKGQDRRYLHMFGANRGLAVEQIDRELVLASTVFYLGGLCALPGLDFDALATLLAVCRENGVATVVDVVMASDFQDSDRVLALLPHMDFFVPNSDEGERLTGEAEPRRQVEALLAHGARTVVVTCGEQGAYAGHGNRRWRMPIFEVEAVDPSGTGDAFCAGLIAGICRDLELPGILRLAAALGASAATAVGTTEGVYDRAALDAVLASRAVTAIRLA